MGIPVPEGVMRVMKKTAVIVACALLSAVVEAQAGPVLIRTPKPYAILVAAIEQRGGTVTHHCQYINAIAAEIPDSVLDDIRALVPPGSVFKDLIVNTPQVAADRRNGGRLLVSADSESVAPLTSSELAFVAAANPDAYLINNTFMNLRPAFSQGIF